MSSHTIEDLTSCILDFQANFIRVTYRKKTTLVDVEAEPAHAAALKAIWASSKLTEILDENGQVLKWRLLGFDSENVEQEFNEVGALGLECLVRLRARGTESVSLAASEKIHPDGSRFSQGQYLAT